jgi:hypothetical protein
MLTADELQQRGRERWLEYQRTHSDKQGAELKKDHGADQDREKSPDHKIEPDSGVEDDFAL